MKSHFSVLKTVAKSFVAQAPVANVTKKITALSYDFL
jgi:hypothetical protein